MSEGDPGGVPRKVGLQPGPNTVSGGATMCPWGVGAGGEIGLWKVHLGELVFGSPKPRDVGKRFFRDQTNPEKKVSKV